MEELDLIVYDELFDEISRSSNDSGEDVLSVQADGDTYIHVSLREDFEMEGVPYVLSIYPTSIDENEIVQKKINLYGYGTGSFGRQP